MKNFPIPRLDQNPQLHDYLIRYCRLPHGEIWIDPQGISSVCYDRMNLIGAQREFQLDR
jgi:hypothetical protein